MANRLAWFLTPAGKKFVSISATVASCGAAFAAWAPHTIFLDNYRDLVELRKDLKPVPVSSQLQSLFSSVMEDLSLNDYYKTITKSFIVFGFDVYQMGSLGSRSGTYIGLPINFTYDSVSSINYHNIFLNNEPVNWNREDAKQLLESLVLSENAKRYAIGREILVTDNNRIIWNSLLSGLLTGGCYAFANHLNTAGNLYAGPRAVRIFLYSISCLFFWGLWAMQKDGLTRYYESEADEHLAQLGENYIKGAIEYTEKALQRNKALRTLLGAQGASKFNAEGDPVFLIRRKNLPLTYQKEFFEKKLKEKTEVTDTKIAINAVN